MIRVKRQYDGMTILFEAEEGTKDVKVTWKLSDRYSYDLGDLTLEHEVTEDLINRVANSFLGSEDFEDAVEFRSTQVLEYSNDRAELALMDSLVNYRVNKRIEEEGLNVINFYI